MEKRFLQIRALVQDIPAIVDTRNISNQMPYYMFTSRTYSNVFPSTTKALRFTTMLELSDARGKKDRSLLPVSFAFAGKEKQKVKPKLETLLG